MKRHALLLSLLIFLVAGCPASDNVTTSKPLKYVPPLTIANTGLPVIVGGVAYSYQYVASGGVPPYTFTLAPTSAALPSGITLSPAGLLSGTTPPFGPVAGTAPPAGWTCDSATTSPTYGQCTATVAVTVTDSAP